MKTWQALSLVILLITMPVLPACDLFGGGKSKTEQEYYQQQLEAIKEAQEDYQKQQEEYNKRLQEGLQEWSEEYQKWQENQLKQQMQQPGINANR